MSIDRHHEFRCHILFTYFPLSCNYLYNSSFTQTSILNNNEHESKQFYILYIHTSIIRPLLYNKFTSQYACMLSRSNTYISTIK